MSGAAPADPDAIDSEKYVVRVAAPALGPWRERLLNHLYRLSLQTPLHKLRLRGRYPLKLLTVPEDPVRGDAERGQEMLAGRILWRGEVQDIASCTFGASPWSPRFARYMQGFFWLRDLGALKNREAGAPIAERLMRAWLSTHGDEVADQAWRGDLAGNRILLWTAYAPLILSSSDIIYRSSVLSTLARMSRHLEGIAGRMSPGAGQIEAWAGIVAAALLMPGGDGRRGFGEQGLNLALATGLSLDGGTLCRSPDRLGDVIGALALLRKAYEARHLSPDAAVEEALARALCAFEGLILGDEGLSSWQGALPLTKAETSTIRRAPALRVRPLRQGRDWGYQRLQLGKTILIFDAAPPPIGRDVEAGSASTLGFELTDGAHRLIVSCGGARAAGPEVPPVLAEALRTTAAHSTLVLADSNSTALLPEGALGKGVSEVEVVRHEADGISRIEASHDGYVRRFGLTHKRTLTLKADGRELLGEDVLVPVRGRKTHATSFAVRFHLGRKVEVSPTADGLGALLRMPDGHIWQFRAQGGKLGIEGSVWIDGAGQPNATQQLVIAGDAPAGGLLINWALRRAG